MNDFDRQIWARTVWMEARGEGHDGMRAVAHVIHNRFKAGRWTFNKVTTVALVCLFDQNFSCWNAARTDNNREAMAILADDDATLAVAQSLVTGVLAGDEDPTHGATHYYSQILATPPVWSAGHTPCAEIGRHLFFKGVS